MGVSALFIARPVMTSLLMIALVIFGARDLGVHHARLDVLAALADSQESPRSAPEVHPHATPGNPEMPLLSHGRTP
jgi:hypothetical protein